MFFEIFEIHTYSKVSKEYKFHDFSVLRQFIRFSKQYIAIHSRVYAFATLITIDTTGPKWRPNDYTDIFYRFLDIAKIHQ